MCITRLKGGPQASLEGPGGRWLYPAMATLIAGDGELGQLPC